MRIYICEKCRKIYSFSVRNNLQVFSTSTVTMDVKSAALLANDQIFHGAFIFLSLRLRAEQMLNSELECIKIITVHINIGMKTEN